MARASKEQWEQARAKWEADPKETFDSIGKTLGVTRAAVHKRAGIEGWERNQSLAEISRLAHLKADKVDSKVDGVTRAKAATAAVDDRVEVLGKQRADWARHREVFGTDADADDKAARHAKTVAEMLLLRHKGEREAHGITSGEGIGGAGQVTVVVKRFSDA